MEDTPSSSVSVVRALGPADAPQLEAFLRSRLASSMFMLSNMRAAGLEDQGRVYQGRYLGAWDAQGQLRAAVCHGWHGALLLQAPEGMDELCHALSLGLAQPAPDGEPRPLTGLIGPWEQVQRARAALGLAQRPLRLESQELLYALELESLQVPEALERSELRARPAAPRDAAQLASWRVEFHAEALHASLELAVARREVEHQIERQELHVLEGRSGLMATSALVARLREAVQIGGVWTPKPLRAQGLGRAVVAAQLALAHAQGCQWATLHTALDNWPARRAYEALGFQAVGGYGLCFFAPPTQEDPAR